MPFPQHSTRIVAPSRQTLCRCSLQRTPSHARLFHPTCHRSAEVQWPKSTNPTPYEIFGLPPTATAAEIKKRYYQLAKQYHPDSRSASAEAEQERLARFRKVVQANELLSTARGRRVYGNSSFDMNVNDIMGDPIHWQGNYEGRFRARRPEEKENWDHGFFNGNKAQPYYTSNANFAGGIIVIMVLAGVLQMSHVQKNTQKTLERGRAVHERASLNLRDARGNAKTSGRRDMIEAFQQRRDVKSGTYNNEDLDRLGVSASKR
jgi:curved DNA-binding protein CbpA